MRFEQQKFVSLVKHVEVKLQVLLQVVATLAAQLVGLWHVVGLTQGKQNGPGGVAVTFGSAVVLQFVLLNIEETVTNERAYVPQAHRSCRKLDLLVPPSNIAVKDLAADMFQLATFWLKLRAPWNIPVKLTTLFTVHRLLRPREESQQREC
jgi:hypothetical protein